MNTSRLISSLRHALAAGALSISALTATAAAGSPDAQASVDPTVVEFLLASSAKDFKASGTGRPSAIRGARVGFFTESGNGVYLLCGAFKSGGGASAIWTPFATIKTSDYEQWLGGTAKAYCGQRSIKWYPGDHSAALQQRLQD